MPNDYEVGHGKPPKHTRWKKGQSGNPNGRSKGRKNARTFIHDALTRTFTIQENGRTRRVRLMEAFINQLTVKALNGSTREQIALFKLVYEYAPELFKESDEPVTITVRFVEPEHSKQQPVDPEPEDLSFLD